MTTSCRIKTQSKHNSYAEFFESIGSRANIHVRVDQLLCTNRDEDFETLQRKRAMLLSYGTDFQSSTKAG